METVDKVSFTESNIPNLAVSITKSFFDVSPDDKNEMLHDRPTFKTSFGYNLDPLDDDDFEDLDPTEPTDDDLDDKAYEDVDEEDDDDYFIDIDEEEGYADDLDPSTDDLGKRSDYID